jgi:hypothetical protein
VSSCQPFEGLWCLSQQGQNFNKYFLFTVGRINTLNNNKSHNDINIYMKYLYSTCKNSVPKIKTNKITRTEIEKIMKSLKVSNSYYGFGETSAKILKKSVHKISSPLTHIFDQALSSGTFPTHFKYSLVIPVYIKEDKQEISNYRPISLLTSFSKILEKIIYIRLYKHVTENNILSVEQFGFKENSSTEKATYKLLKEILDSLNDKKFTGAIFCDLKKAFDN